MCTIESFRRKAATVLPLLFLFAMACSGSDGDSDSPGNPGAVGEAGPQGEPGLTGSDGTQGGDGVSGLHCWDSNGDGEKDLVNEDANGDGGVDIEDCLNQGEIPLAPDGVTGRVFDNGGVLVTSGTIYFVPAEDVAALPAITIEVDSTNDEPLEDAIAANSADYQKANLNADGTYRLETLKTGSYFVTFMPATTDADHLPGGSQCRTAMKAIDMVGARLDLRISSATPADAYYVGSGVCVSCHGKSHISETLHRIGIWSPYERGPLQNLGPRHDDLYMALENKFEPAGGTTIYYYDYDSTRGFDKYKTSEADPTIADPSAIVAFTVTVQKNDMSGDLEMILRNVQSEEDDRLYKVDAIYGGGLYKQRYLTKLTNENGSFYVILPVQFQTEGKESTTYGRTSKVWRDYHGQKWYDETDDSLKEPAPKDSFEKNCVSCHAVGAEISGSDDTVWEAKLVQDHLYDSGDFDFDGDGTPEEVNVGCETCHGPGSRHWDSVGQGKHIVSPSLLTPEREAMICGQCHSRPKGAFGTDSPVDAEGKMMIAGSSRNEFLTTHATTQIDGEEKDYHGDVDKHSKSHHQQYSDFIRSSMYKNGSMLMTCSSCHDPHDRTDNGHQLREDPTDNVGMCGSCHSEQAAQLGAHLVEEGIPAGEYKSDIALCVDCHMSKSAKTGAGRPAKVLQGVQYWENDITSHLFKVPDRALATSDGMTVPYTNKCGGCHSTVP